MSNLGTIVPIYDSNAAENRRNTPLEGHFTARPEEVQVAQIVAKKVAAGALTAVAADLAGLALVLDRRFAESPS